MLKEELVAKSPVRLLEQSIEGGLKTGNIGVIASRKGIGKTSVLVQLALDELMQGKKVIHVSFSAHTSYVIAWYENIFSELAKRRNLENIADIKDELVKNRVIMNFAQEGVAISQILRSLKAMIVDGGFKASMLIVDGFDFARATHDQIAEVKKFAVEMGLEIWYSSTLFGEEPVLDKNNIPVILREYLDLLSVLILLEPKSEYIHFTVVKDHDRMNPQDLKLKLDSKTLLIAETV
jgi:KaiC/GvpD/RAD55 family RecA-like ATPase